MKRINSKCCWYLATLSLWFNSQEPSLWKAPRVHPRNMLTAQLKTAVGWKSSRGVLERVLLLAGVLLILKFLCRGKIVCNCKVRKYTTVSLSSCCAIGLLWQFISSTACRCLSYRPEGVNLWYRRLMGDTEHLVSWSILQWMSETLILLESSAIFWYFLQKKFTRRILFFLTLCVTNVSF